MDILMRLHDMSAIDELREYGEVIYVSQYTNVVGMTCSVENFQKVKSLKNVYYCEKADTGRLLEKAKI